MDGWYLKKCNMLTEKKYRDFCDEETENELVKLGFPIEHACLQGSGIYVTIHISLYEAQKWMREVKKLHITIYSQSQESWQYRITKPHQRLEDGLHGEDYASYEDALINAIKECIEYVK